MLDRPWRGGVVKPSLVIDDHVQRTADGVAVQLAEVQAFLDDALAGKRGVAVDENVHGVHAVDVVRAVLFGSGASEGDRVDELQMARVERQRQVDLATFRRDPVAAVTQVILHVAPTPVDAAVHILELAEDQLRTLVDDVGQDVQPAAMRHAEDDLVDALAARLFHREIQQRDEAFSPFKGEALRPKILPLDELLEDHCIGQPRQDADLFIASQFDPVFDVLHAFLQPSCGRTDRRYA